MAQMPEEGKKFSIVDRYWRDIMMESVSKCITAFIVYMYCIFMYIYKPHFSMYMY